jgi:hypothetical protein
MTKQRVTVHIELKDTWEGKLSSLMERINERIDNVIGANKWNLADVDFDKITLDMDSESDGYGGTYVTLTATIPRLETDEEYHCRLKREKKDEDRKAKAAEMQLIHEKQELVRLAAKFGKSLV